MLLPVERRAAATVRRPWASSVPVNTVINFLQVGAVNNGRKGRQNLYNRVWKGHEHILLGELVASA